MGRLHRDKGRFFVVFLAEGFLFNGLDQSIAMQENKKIIFRSDSWRRYLERQEATVVPRLATPRSLAALWTILALVISASLTILAKKAPIYSPGLAIAGANVEMNNGDGDFTILLSGQPQQAF